jgi:uncharacterized membrane protein YsdA (DUF1294 family)
LIALAALVLGVLNLATFLVFGWDKLAAADGRSRVPERLLLLLAALGGSPGALLARPVFRHKTRKQPFGAWLMLIVFAQVVAVVVVLALWWAGRHGLIATRPSNPSPPKVFKVFPPEHPRIGDDPNGRPLHRRNPGGGRRQARLRRGRRLAQRFTDALRRAARSTGSTCATRRPRPSPPGPRPS